MLTKLHAEYEGGMITAMNEAVKAMKLIQIACGVVYDNEGNDVVIPSTDRLAVTREIIEEAGSKVIVFVPFTSALESVAEYLRKHFTVEIVSGKTGKGERDRIFGAFQNGKDPHVIVANAGTMSHGLTLTAASVIIWFAPPNSAETYEQACARITRPGQKLNQLIVNIEGSAAERALYNTMSHGLTLTAASVIIWFAPPNSAETYEQACARITRPGQKLNQLIVNIEGSAAERALYKRQEGKSNTQGLLLEIFKEKM